MSEETPIWSWSGTGGGLSRPNQEVFDSLRPMEPRGSKWASVVKEGLAAFAKDPSYAIAIAQQGATLANQQEARQERVLLSSAQSVPSRV